MKGDLSRTSFDRERHYASVRKQQGRVDVEADWNEAEDIAAHLRNQLGADVVGREGGPIDAAAFLATGSGADLRLSAGRYYVDGMLCENEAEVSAWAQPDLPPDAPVVLTPGPVTAGSAPDGVYLTYLHVWPQHRSAVEEPDLREEALRGPDTTTRIRTVWQVGLLRVDPPDTPFVCGTASAAYDALVAPSTGTLAAAAEPDLQPPADCSVPTTAGYRGLDNQLYRVEVLTGGAPGTATFAWSRDNGSVVANWVAGGDTAPLTLVLEQAGRAGSAGFSGGCFVELTDDQHEQQFQPGTLAKVKTTVGDQVELDPAFVPTGPTAWAASRVRPRARRWDGFGTVPANGSAIDLELGISVTFSNNPNHVYRTGDYWTFTARSTSRRIDWPESAPNTPIPRTPDGPHHAYARLAVVSKAGANWARLADCRPLFAPLTDQTTLSYLGGDGQTVPSPPAGAAVLAEALRVGVSTGGRPLADALVKFQAQPATGTLTVVTGTGVSQAAGQRVVRTGADGVAAVTWQLDATTPLQSCTATLVDDLGAAQHLTVRFGARLLRASEVTYDPAACANLAGANTVQQALDVLCALNGAGCATLTISPGTDWVGALAGLPAGESATVCFRPGLYQAPKRAVIKGLPHVRLTGGGAATQIEVLDDEAAIEFRDCGSVEVADLALKVTRFPDAPVGGQDGVITGIDVGALQVRDVGLSCPAWFEHRAACLAVRPDVQNRPADTVRVLDCDLTVGHGQTGVLLASVSRSAVRGCSIRTPAKPAALNLAKLLESTSRRRMLIRRIVGRPTHVATPAGVPRPGGPGIMLGNDWRLTIASTVPLTEWQELIAEKPPTAADLATKDTVDHYVGQLLGGVIDEPQQLPSFKRQMNMLSSRLTGDFADFFEIEASKDLRKGILAADLLVTRLRQIPGRGSRDVDVPVTGGVVRFESHRLGQAGWNRLLAAVPPTAAAQANPVAMIGHLRAVATKILVDKAFGVQFAPEIWKLMEDQNPAAGYRGVVVAGVGADRVDISGNRMVGVSEGIHVAFSGAAANLPSALGVNVGGNEITLAVPVELEAAPRGIYVGNTQRVNVSTNNIACQPGGGRALVGIELAGVFGCHMLVRDNVAERCNVGIFADPHFPGDVIGVRQYAVLDNVAPDANPTVVTTHPIVRKAGNLP